MTDKELKIAKESMHLYIQFIKTPGTPKERKDFYRGAAAAINDLLCRCGYGDLVDNLAEELQE